MKLVNGADQEKTHMCDLGICGVESGDTIEDDEGDFEQVFMCLLRSACRREE